MGRYIRAPELDGRSLRSSTSRHAASASTLRLSRGYAHCLCEVDALPELSAALGGLR